MLDTNTSFPLTTKQKNFLQYYAAIHKMSIAEVIRSMIDNLAHEERMAEIQKMKGI